MKANLKKPKIDCMLFLTFFIVFFFALSAEAIGADIVHPDKIFFQGNTYVKALVSKLPFLKVSAYGRPGEDLENAKHTIGLLESDLNETITHWVVMKFLAISGTTIFIREGEERACKVYLDNNGHPVLAYHIVKTCGENSCSLDFTEELKKEPSKLKAEQLCEGSETMYALLRQLHEKLLNR